MHGHIFVGKADAFDEWGKLTIAWVKNSNKIWFSCITQYGFSDLVEN